MDRLNALTGISTLKTIIGDEGDVIGILYRHIPIDPSFENNESRYRCTFAYSYPSDEKDKDDETPEETFNDVKRRIKENRPEGELTSILLEIWELAKVKDESDKENPLYKKKLDQLKKRPLRDIDPLSVKEWETTRVTLLGDAVHAMNIWGALGTNTALEDAFHFSEALRNFDENNWREGFYQYEKEMRIRAHKNVMISRNMALSYHVSYNTRVGISFRNLRYKFMGIMLSIISLWKGNGLGS